MEKIDGSSSGPGPVKVVIIGPESTGKTTLAKQLAAHFHTKWVPEYAREYLDRLGRSYREEDLVEIAKGQLVTENRIAKSCAQLMICDTDFLVLKVWSDYKFGRCDPYIENQLIQNPCKLYLLSGVDVPWQFDPQRENPTDRSHLYALYLKELKALQTPFQEISGSPKERFTAAIEAIDTLF